MHILRTHPEQEREMGMACELRAFPAKAVSDHELWLRRQAIQIAAQMPDDKGDAIAILKYAADLVESFLGPPTPA